MKGSIGTATYLSYIRPYWGKSIAKLNYIDKLSPEAKVRYKAINLYSSGDYSLKQICEIFEINRSTFYRWKSFFNGGDLIGFSEDRMRTIRWKDLSLIPQVMMDSLNPVYPVIDAFNEILLIKGGMNLNSAEKRAKKFFLMVGLDPKRLHHYPHEFSGGMKQRAIVVLALTLKPKLIITDEPVTMLDVSIRAGVLN